MKIKKDINEKKHWEKVYKEPVGNQKRSGFGTFEPMRSKDRPKPYKKVNEQDH